MRVSHFGFACCLIMPSGIAVHQHSVEIGIIQINLVVIHAYSIPSMIKLQLSFLVRQGDQLC